MLSLNKDFLSQEEIDALLSSSGRKELDPDEYLSLFDRDALGEIGNISFGTAATTLSTLLHQKVTITTPQVTLLRREDFGADFPTPHVAARVEFVEGLLGSNILAIRSEDAQIIADLMLGGDGTAPALDLNDLHISAVAEAMNQMMGTSATSMASMLGVPVNISPPTVKMVDSNSSPNDFITPAGDILVKVSFHIQVGDLIDSNIMQMISLDFATNLVEKLMGANDMGDSHATDNKAVDSNAASQAHGSAQQPVQEAVTAEYAQPVRANVMNAYAASAAYGTEQEPREEQVAAVGRSARIQANATPVDTHRAAFSSFEEAPRVRGGRNLDLLLDIPLGLTVELGRTKKLIRDILDLSTGSIIELDTLAGEPVDILVNNKLIARGEVVVIDENFGVRVTDILSPAERIKRLQK